MTDGYQPARCRWVGDVRRTRAAGLSARKPERSAPEAATFEVPGSRFIGLHGRAAEKTSDRWLRDRYMVARRVECLCVTRTNEEISVHQFPANRWTDLANELGSSFAARAAKHDETDDFVAENYAALTGVFAAGVPEELGGSGASVADLAGMLRTLAHHCSSTAPAGGLMMTPGKNRRMCSGDASASGYRSRIDVIPMKGR